MSDQGAAPLPTHSFVLRLWGDNKRPLFVSRVFNIGSLLLASSVRHEYQTYKDTGRVSKPKGLQGEAQQHSKVVNAACCSIWWVTLVWVITLFPRETSFWEEPSWTWTQSGHGFTVSQCQSPTVARWRMATGPSRVAKPWVTSGWETLRVLLDEDSGTTPTAGGQICLNFCAVENAGVSTPILLQNYWGYTANIWSLTWTLSQKCEHQKIAKGLSCREIYFFYLSVFVFPWEWTLFLGFCFALLCSCFWFSFFLFCLLYQFSEAWVINLPLLFSLASNLSLFFYLSTFSSYPFEILPPEGKIALVSRIWLYITFWLVLDVVI